MQVKLRKIGNAWGVILPIESIREHLALGVVDVEVNPATKPQSTKTTPKETIIKEEPLKEPINTTRNDFYTICKKHKGYKGSCKCK